LPKTDDGSISLEAPSSEPHADAVMPCPPTFDGWSLDEDLRHVDRLLNSSRAEQARIEPLERVEPVRLDSAHATPSAWHGSDERVARSKAKRQSRDRFSIASLFSTLVIWLSLMLGAMSFVAGGALLCGSLLTENQTFWEIGYPIVWSGQIVLLVGLILQLDRLRKDNRIATERLETVDAQLHELKTTTTALGTMHGPSGAFYAHWADGANPQLLLSDLKSQLDLLAVKLAQTHQA